MELIDFDIANIDKMNYNSVLSLINKTLEWKKPTRGS